MILSARYANPDNTAIILTTHESGDVAVTIDDPKAWAAALNHNPAPFSIPPDPVPQQITPLQARKQLRALGIKAQADAYLQTQPEEVQEEWEFCDRVERSNAFLRSAALAMAPDQDPDVWLDAFFTDANKIGG